MYAWIWRHLPFGLPGKLTGTVLLAGGVAALLWFVAFPWLDPWVSDVLLPWDQGQVTGDWSTDGGAGEVDPSADPDLVGPSGQPLDEHDIPYDTER